MKRVACWMVMLAVVAPAGAWAQEREDRTLLTWEQMRAIINEASGERPLQYVLEMTPYPRVRPAAEYGYKANFRESEVMARLAREFGFSNVEIESFEQPGQLWQATQAELWITKPESLKLYDFRDVAVSVAANSASGDVTAELVDVGFGGRPEDYAGRDVTGKIVLGSAGANVLQRLAVFERGAVGVISYNPIHPEYVDQIGSQSVSGTAPAGKTPGFGWSISPRVGRELAARARAGAVTLRSIVKAEMLPNEMEIVHAVIPGDGSTDQAVAVSGHLYEGYLKQGANDDASGCAVTLEMGRALLRLVAEGKLPRPKRAIHFLWVPEISGTRAWLQKHQDIQKQLIGDLNFDMEGLGLAKNGSFWVIHRMPDTLPSFLNDVSQSMLEFVAELNRERVRYRSGGYGFTLPIVSPNGSRDPFYIKVDKFYGASDHAVFIGVGIPSTMFITWPDIYYHSSHDTPDKLDPTQFKRAAVVGLGALTVLATADEAMGARVAAETLARGTERMGAAQRKGVGYLADAADAAGLLEACKEALNAVRHQTGVEKAAVKSAAVLFPSPADAEKKLAAFDVLLDQRGAALQNEVKAFYKLRAEQMKVAPTEPVPTEMELRAARLIPERAAAAAGQGRRGAGGPPGAGGFGGGAAGPRLPAHTTSELGVLVGQKKTILEIRDFLAGEFEPIPLADVMAYFEAQAKSGAMTLTEKPAPAPPAKKGKK